MDDGKNQGRGQKLRKRVKGREICVWSREGKSKIETMKNHRKDMELYLSICTDILSINHVHREYSLESMPMLSITQSNQTKTWGGELKGCTLCSVHLSDLDDLRIVKSMSMEIFLPAVADDILCDNIIYTS